MLRNPWIMRWAAACALLGAVMLGCGDDKSPSSDDDDDEGAMTAEELQAELMPLVSGMNETAADCSAGQVLDTEANADMFEYLMGEILAPVLAGQPAYQFYGTYQDQTAGDDGTGVAKVSDAPYTGIKVLLVATDTLDSPITGYLLLSNVSLATVIDTASGLVAVDLSVNAKLHEDQSGEEIVLNLENLEVNAQTDEEGELLDLDAELDLSGSACGLSYEIDMDLDLQEGMDLTGWYSYDGLTVNYAVAAHLQPDTALTAHIWTGPSQNPTVSVILEAQVGDSTGCLTGSINVRGTKQADIVSTGCGTDSLEVFLVVQGEQIPAEEVLGELLDLLEGIEIPTVFMRNRAEGVYRMCSLPKHITHREFWLPLE
ncbi:MAG: hypothetical protein V1774_06020 [Candidatus Eisenbacteria bacterium]